MRCMSVFGGTGFPSQTPVRAGTCLPPQVVHACMLSLRQPMHMLQITCTPSLTTSRNEVGHARGVTTMRRTMIVLMWTGTGCLDTPVMKACT